MRIGRAVVEHFLVRRAGIALCLLLGGAGCVPSGAQDWPPFVQQLIDEYEAEPTSNPPASIWRYGYQGRVVFYVPPRCCDVASELYESDGTLLCGPDGGLTGKGDGKCPDFFERRTDEVLVWRDRRN